MRSDFSGCISELYNAKNGHLLQTREIRETWGRRLFFSPYFRSRYYILVTCPENDTYRTADFTPARATEDDWMMTVHLEMITPRTPAD